MPLQTSKALKAEAPKPFNYLDAEVMTKFALKKARSWGFKQSALGPKDPRKQKPP